MKLLLILAALAYGAYKLAPSMTFKVVDSIGQESAKSVSKGIAKATESYKVEAMASTVERGAKAKATELVEIGEKKVSDISDKDLLIGE